VVPETVLELKLLRALPWAAGTNSGAAGLGVWIPVASAWACSSNAIAAA